MFLIILRNLTQTLRNWYIDLFAWCGKITLETYISQFHVWLSTENVPNGQPGKLMAELIPKYPLVNWRVSPPVWLLRGEYPNASSLSPTS